MESLLISSPRSPTLTLTRSKINRKSISQSSRTVKTNSHSLIRMLEPLKSLHATRSVSAGVLFGSSFSKNPASSEKTFRISSLFSGGGKVDESGPGPGVPSWVWIRALVKGLCIIAVLALACIGSFGPPVHLQPFIDKIMIFPVAWNLVFGIWTCLWAWLWMPKLLKAFYKDAAALLSGKQVPYEQSFCKPLEVSVRYLFSSITCLRLMMGFGPTASKQFRLDLAEKAVHFFWCTYCLDRWKEILLSHTLAAQSDNEDTLALSIVSSLGIYAGGLMVVAEKCGKDVQSILVDVLRNGVTGFFGEYIVKNALVLLLMLLTNCIAPGDNVKVGSTEGIVAQVGLLATSLLTAAKSLVRVPNSSILNQVLENMSRNLSPEHGILPQSVERSFEVKLIESRHGFPPVLIRTEYVSGVWASVERWPWKTKIENMGLYTVSVWQNFFRK